MSVDTNRRKFISATASTTILIPTMAHSEPLVTPKLTKREIYQSVADMCVQIESGNHRGSGFFFGRCDIIVTNAHVVMDEQGKISDVFAVQGNKKYKLKIRSYSPEYEYDFAIFQVENKEYFSSRALNPDTSNIYRGDEVITAGFPHGFPDLITYSSEVSAPISGEFFSINAMIHNGHSGGPVITADGVSVKGITSAKRYPNSKEIDDIYKSIDDIKNYATLMSKGSVGIMGINFTKFVELVTESASINKKILDAWTSTGIGLCRPIIYALQSAKELGIF